MKIFVNCQNDAFNKSHNAMQKRYNMGQALIDAVSSKEEVILLLETRTDNYCKDGTPGWNLIDELQAVIETADDLHMQNITAIQSSNHIALELIPCVRKYLQFKTDTVEFIGPLLDVGILQNIILLVNTVPNIKIKIDLRKCGSTNRELQKASIALLKSFGIEIAG